MSRGRTDRLATAGYAGAVFLAAFLLFQVQPIAGRVVLPWFGGGPAVWTSCMLFFQLSLLGGYAYAHLLAARLRPRTQALLHLVLLLLSLAVLPITPAESWKPQGVDAPTWRILGLLTVNLGVPFWLAASTSPLLQRWFAADRPGASPYRLYALSNAGSLLGLVTYPFVIEPLLGLRLQTLAWSAGYVLFAAVCGACAVTHYRRTGARNRLHGEGGAAIPAPPLARELPLLWLSLAACGSLLLLATTTHMTQDVAPVPLLWVLPLVIYLLSFIICFDRERWYARRLWAPAMLVGAAAVTWTLFQGEQLGIVVQIATLSFALLASCMVCHGELARLKPDPRRLTSFYLYVAAGGALGGLLAGVVAPRLFDGYAEYPVALVAGIGLFALCLLRDSRTLSAGRRRLAATGLGLAALALATALGLQHLESRHEAIATTRSFYGVLSVRESAREGRYWRRYLWHGRLNHGGQLLRPEHRSKPITYYGPGSGAAVALDLHPRRLAGRPVGLRIGVVGLGVGTIAAMAGAGDTVRFYEINPDVVELSERYFTYRSDSLAEQQVVLGDARISLERELREGGSRQFDVLLLDAFNSDAVPVHLLTREAFELYWRHLRADGILVVHISAIHLDLSPLVRSLADSFRKQALRVVRRHGERNTGLVWSDFVLLTSNRAFLEDPRVQRHVTPWAADSAPGEPWTDDFSNLFSVLRPRD